jgi:hypothetical protein
MGEKHTAAVEASHFTSGHLQLRVSGTDVVVCAYTRAPRSGRRRIAFMMM